jgi:hypothetical protein
VEGQVLTQNGRQPVPGALVQVQQAGRAGGYAALGPPTPADAAGRFRFTFEGDEDASYLLTASAAPGYRTDFNLAPALTPGRKNTGLVVPVLAPAWVRLQLVDELPRSRVVMYVSGYEGSGTRFVFPRDTIFIRPKMAEFPGKIIWVITEDGVDRQAFQDINLTPLDTITVRIPF